MKVQCYSNYCTILGMHIYYSPHAELERLAPHCMHIKAVKTLIEAFDTEHELTPNDFLNGNIMHELLYE